MSADHDTTSNNQAAMMAQYQDYYAVREGLDINIVPLAADAMIPSQADFAQHAPAVFKLASELQVVDASAIAQLRGLGDAAKVISDVLNQQNRKLTALLGYLLRNEDDPEHRFQAFEYGGAGIGFNNQTALAIGQWVEIKIFLPAESAAIYCLGQVCSCEPTASATSAPTAQTSEPEYQIKVLFQRIEDSDRELLIRASMHAQTRLLKKRANERNESPQ